ncbi:DUF3822 family protein [Flavobacterium columnare]|uniref:DUF3822 family protein n=1 Tax=Flavobacterium columnare TaxID=996 RepID=A0AAI8CGG4_9FLAO|nr:DUF3822 family protein [Flavobacterium columnare]AMO19338.1 DUF3822 family protein [Flavobacterium columnare]AUX17278.1 hypothetical protein AQ623_02435 [Flavobacterium columnare]MEB3800117.1 DUF3822 family protein [Flavobacterium columnare]QOG56292.1 DUF3822 family protein [Flavobacterium columnare]QOG59015.1 DUF3822 family protein [Flavobacterium columnare]
MQTSTNTILNKEYKKLLLQISLHEVSFCLYNTLESKIEFFSNYILTQNNTLQETEEEILNLIRQSTVLQTGFDDVLILHDSTLNSFVPQALFDEQYLKSYLHYNVKVSPDDFVTYDEVTGNDMNNIYIPFVKLNNALIDLYGQFHYKHTATILVKKILETSKNVAEPQIFAHIQEKQFQIIVVKNQKLLLYNSFEYHKSEDFIYHLLFTTEQLKLNPESVIVKLLGKITKNNELFEIAYKYIRNVSLYTENLQFDQSISEDNYLKNFILIHACE